MLTSVKHSPVSHLKKNWLEDSSYSSQEGLCLFSEENQLERVNTKCTQLGARGQDELGMETPSRESGRSHPAPTVTPYFSPWKLWLMYRLPVPADSEKKIQRSDFHIKDFHTSWLLGLAICLSISNPGLESHSLNVAKIYILLHFPVSSRVPQKMKRIALAQRDSWW